VDAQSEILCGYGEAQRPRQLVQYSNDVSDLVQAPVSLRLVPLLARLQCFQGAGTPLHRAFQHNVGLQLDLGLGTFPGLSLSLGQIRFPLLKPSSEHARPFGCVQFAYGKSKATSAVERPAMPGHRLWRNAVARQDIGGNSNA
jgi:hypothetical protein